MLASARGADCTAEHAAHVQHRDAAHAHCIGWPGSTPDAASVESATGGTPPLRAAFYLSLAPAHIGPLGHGGDRAVAELLDHVPVRAVDLEAKGRCQRPAEAVADRKFGGSALPGEGTGLGPPTTRRPAPRRCQLADLRCSGR